MYIMNNIEITCDNEISDYFNCIEQYNNMTNRDKLCQNKIHKYYKCLDNKKYTECYLKKKQRERENKRKLILDSSKIDYQEHSVLSSL